MDVASRLVSVTARFQATDNPEQLIQQLEAEGLNMVIFRLPTTTTAFVEVQKLNCQLPHNCDPRLPPGTKLGIRGTEWTVVYHQTVRAARSYWLCATLLTSEFH